jgi:gamma-glutamylcyclotransferase (GGCT)/AIG2-like uncharacterized protein YtfP
MPVYSPTALPAFSSMPRTVFVYGTLRAGEERDINLLTPAPRLLGTANVAGVMFDLDTYPGLRLGGLQQVIGEVYAITEELEIRLDAIEQVWPEPNGEYAKRYVAVMLDAWTKKQPANAVNKAVDLLPDTNRQTPIDDQVAISCLVYEATAEAVLGKPGIGGGDWIAYRLSKAA